VTRQITVCGIEDGKGMDLFCILPPEHARHTTNERGVTWHKAVDVRGNGMSFATTPPGYVAPKLTDLAGLFTAADTQHLCSVHWVRYQRSDAVAEWWDETCEHCDHQQALPLFPELEVARDDR
jgi:hypothetical protein